MRLDSGLSARGPHRARRYRRETPQTPQTPAPPAPPVVSPETVPEGMTKVADLLAWAREGDDQVARAQLVLQAEQDKPEADRRKTLIADLTDLILEH